MFGNELANQSESERQFAKLEDNFRIADKKNFPFYGNLYDNVVFLCTYVCNMSRVFK